MGKLSTRRGPALVVAVLAAMATLMTGCSPSASPSSGDTTLTVGATLEPPSLDPTTNSSASIPNFCSTTRIKPLFGSTMRGTSSPCSHCGGTSAPTGSPTPFNSMGPLSSRAARR